MGGGHGNGLHRGVAVYTWYIPGTEVNATKLHSFLEMKTSEANNSKIRARTEYLFNEEMLPLVGNFSTA